MVRLVAVPFPHSTALHVGWVVYVCVCDESVVCKTWKAKRKARPRDNIQIGFLQFCNNSIVALPQSRITRRDGVFSSSTIIIVTTPTTLVPFTLLITTYTICSLYKHDLKHAFVTISSVLGRWLVICHSFNLHYCTGFNIKLLKTLHHDPFSCRAMALKQDGSANPSIHPLPFPHHHPHILPHCLRLALNSRLVHPRVGGSPSVRPWRKATAERALTFSKGQKSE